MFRLSAGGFIHRGNATMSKKENLVERLVRFGVFKNVKEANTYTIKELDAIETKFRRRQYQIVHDG